MNKPKLTAKNLELIQDQLDAQQLAYKKIVCYENQFGDPNLKSLAHEIAQHHKQHFDALTNYLCSHS